MYTVVHQEKLIDGANRCRPHPLQRRRARRASGHALPQRAAGRVLDASVLRGSGNAAVDAKAVDVIQRASPVPQMAPDMPQSRIELSFPVQVYQ